MRRSVVVTLLLATASCSSRGRETVPDVPAPVGSALSLDIQLVQDDWVVRVNRPAMVALFEIVPNRGAGLLFPEPGREDGKLAPGSTRVFAAERRLILAQRTRYLRPWNAGGLDHYRSTVVDQATGPTVVIGIACECQLRLDALSQPDGPREVLGTFNRLDPQFAARDLAEAVLPSEGVNWTTARYEYSSGGPSAR